MKKYIYILFIAATMMSCGDFLEEESQSEVIPKTTTDFSELLIGNGYPDGSGPDLGILSMLDDDCELDMVTKNWDGSDFITGNTTTVKYSAYYQWQPSMCDVDGEGENWNTTISSTFYSYFYRRIMGCNAVLDLIDEALGSQADRDRIKAEALAVRSYLYFQLVNIFGEPYNYNKSSLGVPLKLDSDLSDESIPRATVQEAYEDVIVPGLVEAARLLDPLDIMRKNYRINQPAIHIILSRVYLFMERYEDAIAEANKAIAQGAYLSNLPAEGYASMSTDRFSYSNPEVEWLTGSQTYFNSVASYYRPGMCTAFRALWDWDNDVRVDMFGIRLANSWDMVAKPSGSINLSQTIRGGEAYLNRMEAEALSGKTAAALNDLNLFRKNRIRNYVDVNLSGDELLSEIRTERRKEFCFEGFRWFDLRRYGMPQITHLYRAEVGGPLLKYTLKEKDPMYTIPFPSILFEKNTALIQNESRNGAARVGEVVNE